MERKFEITAGTVCSSVSFDLYRCEWTLVGDLLERNVCYLYTHYCESSKSLEGDRSRNRVWPLKGGRTPEVKTPPLTPTLN